VKSNKIVVGRDARISGEMVKNVVCGTLMGMGFDVVDIGLATTPTTEIAVTMEGACGGIILTASHNPRMWNALKLLNEKGEFLNKREGEEVLRIAEAEDFEFADVDHLGHYRQDNTYDQKHIDLVKNLELVDVEAIRKANFRVALDTVNSVGGIILPKLLEQLGVKHLVALIGGSYGGMQVMDWITRCPGETDLACVIASSASLNTQALAFDVVGRNAVGLQPEFDLVRQRADLREGRLHIAGVGVRHGLHQHRRTAAQGQRTCVHLSCHCSASGQRAFPFLRK
jgi:hypothetical protein